LLTSLSLMFLIGLLMGAIFEKLKLPRIIGMFITGVVLGPFVLDLFDPNLLAISADLRQIALIIILIKAGLSLDISDLKKVGRPALLLSFLPASFEILAYTILAPILLGINRIEAALMGSVLAAVSPAVVVPKMTYLIENKYGDKKSIPQMIMAAASCDDVFVIVLFASFLNIAKGGSAKIRDFLDIPMSIILGIALGIVVGYILYYFFEKAYEKNQHIRNSMKVIIILASAFACITIEKILQDKLALSGLLAVLSMACMLKMKTPEMVSNRLSEKFSKLWLAAEVVLFVLVGASVDINYTAQAGPKVVIAIFLALAIRALGVFISLLKTNLNKKERLFCIFAYMPKATVQAAIGSVPLQEGLSCGNIILSVAVMAILLTAPLGAFAIDKSHKKLLSHDI
jgi:NhaP-type Na+/H+ or K+/H+ antiporter